MSQDKSRFRTYLEVVAGIVTVLAVVVPTGIFLAEHFWKKTEPPIPSQPAVEATLTRGPAVVPTAAAATPLANLVFLESLTPDTGSTNLGSLPRALQGSTDHLHSVTIPCGSNNVGDQKRDVTYVLNGRYLSLRAVVRPFKGSSDESQVQVNVYPDNHSKTTVQLNVNASQDLSVDLDGTKRVTIQVVCELPGALAVLADAALVHA
ncbi:MAG: hypothetical protein QOE61_2836 [Micromonosporaceae bacterium]|nr:hypothetical protein [Micromonosporaceae bacterium]